MSDFSLHEGDPEDESRSLLQLFNTMPSPEPNPDVVTRQADQDSLYSILASDVPGLKTSLYDYQRRSAAVMLQRESAPGKILDPRLVQGQDQNGIDYYFDISSGTILKDPRYYDGVKGGILAEQMGSGKTLICLSVILATRHSATRTPELYQGSEIRVRKRIGSLADMAAASATRKGAPWKAFFDIYNPKEDCEYTKCINAIRRNPGMYHVPAPPPKRLQRGIVEPELPPRKIWHTHASLVVVPNNLVQQWVQEINKHTAGEASPAGLKVLKLVVRSQNETPVPSVRELTNYDIVLISKSRLLKIYKETMMHRSPLGEVHFKRCIVDEGHQLGYSRMMSKSNLLLALDNMFIQARWIVTGTPSPGLYGVDDQQQSDSGDGNEMVISEGEQGAAETERQDLEKIGAIASLYLNARPWANIPQETEDYPAEWAVYVMQPIHSARSSGRRGVLRATLNSLLVRHQLSDLNNLLPVVNEKVVTLDGSYQDKLSHNLFSMMIIFNAVQSQRTDVDYFFHPRQKKSLLQLLHNLKQASFFGGSFFSPEDVKKSLETAEEFIEKRKVPITKEDEALLRQAMDIARIGIDNSLKQLSNQYNEIPVFVRDFLPNGASAAWSLNEQDSNPTCTDAGMVMALQKLIRSALGDATKINSLLNGRLLEEGHKESASQVLSSAEGDGSDRRPWKRPEALAGNTKLGGDRIPRHLRANAHHQESGSDALLNLQPPEPLEKAELISTASAKLSYLIDAVVEHQEQEKIIIFYDHENVAWYLASMLEVLHVPHFIYAKALPYDRKMQYVNTFNQDPKYRVILMDLSQAAVGLDMRAASRIYFVNPVLNPQTQAQAVGRARRISQQKPVTVETLVLRGSIEEVIVERKHSMSQIEHWKCRSILDDRPIYNWILNAGIIPLPEGGKDDDLSQTVPLKKPQPIFCSLGYGHHSEPEVVDGTANSPVETRETEQMNGRCGVKRPRSPEREEGHRPARQDK
ncbi:putative ATP-dependent helicase [Colletotrichum orbiculare MAFF 240422]|uniref:ATP-dependent helicase n=1 Tax=Colletotrichum orbiculare (strain 104-T / ATCC 96160 / CBS 514.97 / LARS 414 / MAFF 240422) TaxID=1213857 RepID=A0A484G830_COLOR|nr:putative ATP-dependent helicase [Colletotrichum orbiculare MAFF 240422]